MCLYEHENNMKKNFYILIILTFISFGCRKDIEFPNENLKNLTGSWSLYSTSGGFNGEIYYTKSTNEYVIEFSNKGIYKRFEGEKKKLKSKYSIYYSTETEFGKDYYAIKIDKESNNQLIIKLSPDTLILSDNANDGYASIFIKN